MNRFSIISLAALFSISAIAANTSVDTNIDTSTSEIGWVGKKKVGDQHSGVIKVKSGKITLDGSLPKQATIVVDMTSISNKDVENPEYKAKLENHLKSADFFDTEKFPEATFKLTKATPNKMKDSYKFDGDLTIKNITHPISFNGNMKQVGDHYELMSDLKFDRAKYDVKYNSGKFFDVKKLGDKLIVDDIELKLSLKTAAVQGLDKAAKKK